MNSWERLGLAPTNDKRAIKRAYASKLKADKGLSLSDIIEELHDLIIESIRNDDNHVTCIFARSGHVKCCSS